MALSRLHTLSLNCFLFDRFPLSLASLPPLQRLCLEYMDEDAALSLPPGPWAASLRWLAAPWWALHANTDLLRVATALEHLSCHGLRSPDGEDAASRALWTDFWARLEVLPALRCLCIHHACLASATVLPPALGQAVLTLAGRRPALRLHLLETSGLMATLLYMADIPASLPALSLGYVF